MYHGKISHLARGSAFMNGLRRIKNKFRRYIVRKLRTGSTGQQNDRIYQSTGKHSTTLLSRGSTVCVEKGPLESPLPGVTHEERSKTIRVRFTETTKLEKKSQRIKAMEDRQRELFRKSGPQIPKSQRKAERKAAVAEYEIRQQQQKQQQRQSVPEEDSRQAKGRGSEPRRKKERRKNVICTPGPSAIPLGKPLNLSEQERIQRELFRTSGPKIPRRQRKRERRDYCREQRRKHEQEGGEK